MKIRTPSLIGSAAWAVYFFTVLIVIFLTVLGLSWHMAVGVALFALGMAVLTVGGKLISAAVGYVDTEFVIGLLAGVALAVVAVGVFGKLHGPGAVKSRSPHSQSISVPRPNNSFKPTPNGAA